MQLSNITAFCLCGAAFTSAIGVHAGAAPKKDTTLHAIVDGNGWLLGASTSGRWVTKPNLNGVRTYTVYGANSRLGSVTCGKPVSLDAPCPDQTAITPKLPAGAVVAIDAPWNALPRMPRHQDTKQAAYQTFIKQFLQSHGIKNPDVRIDQIIRCDVDNDGTEEVAISAHRYLADEKDAPSTEPDAAFHIHTADVKAGDYAIVLLRKQSRGKVVTIPLAGEFYPKDREFVAPSTYQIQGMYDLKGDGRMQILLGSRYYEGQGTQVLDIHGLKAEDVLDSGCGA